MKDKIKALDRNVIAFVVIALLAFGTYALTGTDNPASTNEDTAVAQEAEVSETSEETETEVANEAAPTEEATETETAPVEESAETPEAETENSNTYDYTAQVGDSYAKIARKAVQTYGIINDVDLSEAQIIYAETRLTKEAGEPLLEVGEAVAISESAIASTVEAAGELDEATEALWADYAVGVDFNTDAVGEARE